mgnify:CR=1 FL=1
MKNVKVVELVNEIKTNLTQTSSSTKDEERVMRAMLNDREYTVDIYSKEGKTGTFCPAEEVRNMLTSVISSAVKISADEAKKLADEHEFKKSESQAMINISKEFINTYLQTGRKLPLGGRETSDVSLSKKDVKASIRTYPRKVGVNPDGTARYDHPEAPVKAHSSVRVHSSCPPWV